MGAWAKRRVGYPVRYPTALRQRPSGLPDRVSAHVLRHPRQARPLITKTRAHHNSDMSEKSGPFRQLGRYCSDMSELLRGGASQAGSEKSGFRLAMNASAPSTMSSLPTAWVSIPRPVRNESRAAFHQMLELILVISR